MRRMNDVPGLLPQTNENLCDDGNEFHFVTSEEEEVEVDVA